MENIIEIKQRAHILSSFFGSYQFSRCNVQVLFFNKQSFQKLDSLLQSSFRVHLFDEKNAIFTLAKYYSPYPGVQSHKRQDRKITHYFK